jgi:hypothetical protein
MRYPFALLAAALGLLWPALAGAQPPAIAKIEKVRIGFRAYNDAVQLGRYKPGLWTPVYIEVTAGPRGLPKESGGPYLQVETPDYEGVGTIYRIPVVLDPNETRTFVAYTKFGSGDDNKVTLHAQDRTFYPPPERDLPMLDLHGQVYLALGRRVADLPAALRAKEDKDKDKGNDAQFQDEGRVKAALFEDRAELLPAHWFGYDGVDVIFLSADNKDFLTRLADPGRSDQLKALATWVRRGGRLVIPMTRQTQDLVANLLSKPAWQPPVPVIPPAQPSDKFPQPDRLAAVESWGEVVNMPLPNPGDKAPSVAQLEPANFRPGDWDVEARVGADGPPLIARVKYGLGQIVYFAFSFDDPAFSQWQGHSDFLRKAVAKLAPKTGQNVNPDNRPFGGGFRKGESAAGDVTGQLINALDNFDVRVIPFGVVALFIILYVVIVGPLEFILLKYVFGRLEWTWITFPAVVLGVSVVAYFGAYALKGQDLRVNKIDIIDVDLRTDATEQGQPRSARVFGQSIFMILSPRIQSYTVGIEPNPVFWGDKPPADPPSADVVAWMARPDPNAFGGIGRSGGQGFFRKPYYYGSGDPREETTPHGLSGVPIPVWMAKAFGASWEMTAAQPPVVAELAYHRNPVAGKDTKIIGTLQSNFAVDLTDVWLFYADRCYPIEGGLPAGKGDRQPVKVQLDAHQARLPREWYSEMAAGGQRPSTSQGLYDPSSIVKQVLFHEQLDPTHTLGNQALRRLDLSWRLYEEPPRALPDRRTREAILFARVKFLSGDARALTSDPSQPLPTQLWLGELPAAGRTPPPLTGTLNQDTFIRVILPVRPAGN